MTSDSARCPRFRALLAAVAAFFAMLYTAPVAAQAKSSNEAAAGQVEELSLSVGENKTIPATGVKSYSEGVRGIADVRLTPDTKQFVIVGQKPGSTSLLLIKDDGSQLTYEISVYPRSMDNVRRELLQLLDGTTGVRVRRVGSRLFIEGGVSNEPELKRLQQIAALFPQQVESLVVLGGAAAERKLNIRVDFIFVQYDRSRGYQFGVNWPGSIGGPGVASVSANYDLVATTVTSAQAAVVNQPLPGLDIAATNGWAKVLKHSTVVTSNGSKADFSSGGEQNYLVSTDFTAQLAQITFGTNVKVLPRYDPVTKELEVQVDAEVTDLTPPVAAGTILPGRNVSKLSTLVALKLGQSIVLSGIRSRSQRHATSGLPLLSQVPLLGVFFGSHSDRQDEVDGAIFVVPSVIESVPRRAREIIEDALSQYDDYGGNIDAVRTWDKDPSRAPGVRVTPNDNPTPHPPTEAPGK